jgi:hypothetical protein
MNNEKIAIRVLGFTATVLLLALLFVPSPVTGQEAVHSDDYIVATHPSNQGSDVLYIADTRSGQLAVFIFDNATKTPVLADVEPIATGFRGR